MAREAKDSVPADARIVSRAFPPASPSFPKRLPIILVATLSMLLVGAAIVVTRELLSGRAYIGGTGRPASASEEGQPAPRALPAPIGAVERPALKDDPGMSDVGPIVVAAASEPEPVEAGSGDERAATPPVERDHHSLHDALRILGVACDASATTGIVVAMTAADAVLARDGALSIGRALARRRRVVLVDLAGDNPDAALGLGDVVEGRATFLQVLHRDAGSRLHLMGPGSTVAGEPATWQPILQRSLEALRGAYDCVLVSSPSPAVSRVVQEVALIADIVLIGVMEDGGDRGDAVRAALLPGSAEPLVVSLMDMPADALAAG